MTDVTGEETVPTYGAAMARLKELVGKLESAQVDVDEMEAVVKEAVLLITSCRRRLRTAQSSVDVLLAGLNGDAVVTAPVSGAVAGTATASPIAIDADADPFADEG